jgi:hypothetical protein
MGQLLLIDRSEGLAMRTWVGSQGLAVRPM